jgi:AraC-like DNA-binding protein
MPSVRNDPEEIVAPWSSGWCTTSASSATSRALRPDSSSIVARTHRVADYAAALGYSVRTLTRATLAATGRTAKQHLDARILLEAKRLLVHTDASAAAVGAQLGFADAGDFTKFFRKRAGRTPLEFRATARGLPG